MQSNLQALWTTETSINSIQSSRQVKEKEFFRVSFQLHASNCPPLHWIVEHHVHTFSNGCYWRHLFSLTDTGAMM